MNALRRVIPFIRPYRLIAFFMVITVILPVAMELMVPRALRYVIDSGIEVGDMSAIVRGSLFMLATALIGAVATLGQGVCRAELSQGLAYDFRNRMFAHIQTFSFANLDHMQTGQLMTRLSSDVDMVRIFFSAGVALFLRAILMVVGSLVMMVIIDAQLAMIMLILLPIAAVIIWGLMHLARPLFVIVQQKLGGLNTSVQENLAGVQVVKAFVRERFEIARFGGFNHDYMLENIKVGRLMAFALPVLTVLTNLGIVAVVWWGGLSVMGGRLSVGELVAFNSYLMIGMAPLMLLGNVLTMFSRADASAERMFVVLDTQPVIHNIDVPLKAEVISGRVVFSDVAFHYSGNSDGPVVNQVNRDVLRGISFSAEPGQRIALLGATGSGKSSLVNLIPRFYDVDAGQIKIDGVDVRDWELDVLRSNIGVVLQQTTLFSGTIHENIAYGRPTATIDDVIAAAKAAQAHDFINALPHAYESPVEERGANFSGGQKQRIAIARALLVAPTILILDDSTSAVDLETEAKLQKALEKLMRDCTTFIVAQRISSVLNADKILVLEHGRIAAEGTHTELIAHSQIYQEIVASQLGDGPPVSQQHAEVEL